MKPEYLNEIKKDTFTVLIGAGSNIGDREYNIARAFLILEKIYIKIETASLFESAPLYYTEQDSFLNTVFRVTVPDCYSINDVLDTALETENTIGRLRDPSLPKGPRVIDLDILVSGSSIINSRRLLLPHPGIRERLFVLLPLLELEPDLKDPVSGEKYSAIASVLAFQGVYLFKSCRYIEKYRITGQ